MSPRKARRPATDRTVRGPHGSAKAGELKRAEATFPCHVLQALYDGRHCIGFLPMRGKAGVEAYGANDRSLGIFSDGKAATGAVSAARAS